MVLVENATPVETGMDAVRQALSRTTDALVKCMRALGDGGRPDAASRLGGQAWVALREVAPREADRVNGVMHYLARLPMESDAPPIGTSRLRAAAASSPPPAEGSGSRDSPR